MDLLHNFLHLLLEAAPWLVFGLLLGGMMKALLPTALLQKHLSGDHFGAIGKAALLGAPLPLCSCGVIPAALGLRQAGASKPATVSFLVSTPETGVDSIAVSYALLGPFMAIARPIAALASAFTAGLLVARFDKEISSTHTIPHSTTQISPNATFPLPVMNAVSSAPVTACCSSSASNSTSCCSPKTGELPKSSTQHASSCCDQDKFNNATTTPTLTRWQQTYRGIRYAFTQMLDDMVGWLLLGLFFAALAQTFLPPDFLAQWGQGLPAMLVMLVAGIPMYICATASTPVAAGLMMAGVSPGAALVFLLTGPATNVSTLGVISNELGTRCMTLYLIAVSGVALLAGLTVDLLAKIWQINIPMQLQVAHTTFPHWVEWCALLVLVGLAMRRFLTLKRPV